MLCPSCGRENRSDAGFCDACGEALSQPDRVPAIAGLGCDVFVGRQREIAELNTALEDALSGNGRLVMLAGEPGIGKTRISQELASHAQSLGAHVLWGWCYEEQGAPAYWPWTQPIRSYIQQQAPEQLYSQMGPGAADIAEIVPEIRYKLPDLEPPPALEPDQARFRLFDSITTFLKNVAVTQPLVVVQDDLHWADRSSLLLLEFVVREIGRSRLLLIGTYRDVEVSRRHPLSEALGSLVREPIFRRIKLGGLTRQEVGRFVEVSAGVNPTPALIEAVHSRTDGNPLFVSEVVRLLRQEGLEEEQSWQFRIPEGVRDAIGRRLNRLSELCNQVLSIAAVIGKEFDLKLLGSVSQVSEGQVVEAVEEAVAAGVIEGQPFTAVRYQFTHFLIQETLVDELPTTRRGRLHALIGEALEELYGAGVESRAAELAYHFAEAATETAAEKIVRYSTIAGEQSLATYAYEEALAHFQRALIAKEGQPHGRGDGGAPVWAGTCPCSHVPEAGGDSQPDQCLRLLC